VVTLWVVVVVPLLALALWTAVVALPRLIGTAWASLGKQQDVLSTAWAGGDMIQATARVLAMTIVVITVASILYMVTRFARHSVVTVRRATAGKPAMRILAGILGAAVIVAIAWAWWPNDDNYRPIQASDRGTIGDIFYGLRVESMSGSRTVSDAPRPAAASTALVRGQQGVMRAVWDMRTPPPTKDSPQLAVVLVPRTASATVVGGGGGLVATPSTTAKDGWVFPVDKPLAPEEGDNQALAVNTTDNTMAYDAALAMVYVEGSEAMNVNEAHAYASCRSCGAVAVAYQVVIVLDTDDTDDNVAVPQNLAGALNYDCVNCMTYALAQQLFITIDEPLTEEQKWELQKIMWEMKLYEARIQLGTEDPEEIEAKLDEFNERIVTVVEPNIAPTPTQTSTAPTTGSPTASVAPSASIPSETVAPSPSPSPSGEPTASIEPATSPDTTTEDTTSTDTTGSADNTSAATTPDGATSSEPTTSGDSTTGATTSDGSDGSTTDGSTSGGSPSDGTTSP
jgi:putative peptide zinc metalloprotease protein